jgi:hypothetical protein
MRLRNPTKLGDDSESWLRHDFRVSECVAKTWRYFVSLMRCVVLPLPLPLPLPLALGSLGFLRWRISMGEAIELSVMVAVDVDVAMIAVVWSSLGRGRGFLLRGLGVGNFLRSWSGSRRGSEELMTHGSGDGMRRGGRKQLLGRESWARHDKQREKEWPQAFHGAGSAAVGTKMRRKVVLLNCPSAGRCSDGIALQDDAERRCWGGVACCCGCRANAKT